eukprot:182205-Chlamydomonas_euryale.AAC.3
MKSSPPPSAPRTGSPPGWQRPSCAQTHHQEMCAWAWARRRSYELMVTWDALSFSRRVCGGASAPGVGSLRAWLFVPVLGLVRLRFQTTLLIDGRRSRQCVHVD